MFADMTARHSFRLGEKPSYRSSSKGAGALDRLVESQRHRYARDAAIFRDMRMSKSIRNDPDIALGRLAEERRSNLHYNNAANKTGINTRGIYQSVTPIYSQAFGALSSFGSPGKYGTGKLRMSGFSKSPEESAAPAAPLTPAERRARRLAEIRRRQQEMLGGQVRDRPAALVPVRRGQVMIAAPPPNYYNPLPNAAAIGGGTPAYQPGNRASPAFERRAGSAVATAIATPGRPARNPDFTHRSPASPGNGAGGMMHEPPAARRGLSLTPIGYRRSKRHLNPIAYLPVDDWRK
jgi:hypothetical protein